MQNSEMVLSSNQYMYITRGRLYAKSDMCSLQLAACHSKGQQSQADGSNQFWSDSAAASFCMDSMQATQRAQKLSLTWKTLGLMLRSTCGPDMMRS